MNSKHSKANGFLKLLHYNASPTQRFVKFTAVGKSCEWKWINNHKYPFKISDKQKKDASTWNKKHWWIKPVEVQVKAQSNGFICDQKDEINHRQGACENSRIMVDDTDQNKLKAEILAL